MRRLDDELPMFLVNIRCAYRIDVLHDPLPFALDELRPHEWCVEMLEETMGEAIIFFGDIFSKIDA